MTAIPTPPIRPTEPVLEEPPVRYHTDGGVATITLNRPAALNACDVALKEGLILALSAAAEDPQVRAVVLTGAGRAFCVGQDLREHAALLTLDETGAAALSTVTEHYNPIVRAIAGLPKPTIAAVNGMAAGAGAGLAFACDLRLAAEGAGFLLAFAGIGLGADSGCSWTLPRLVGWARATALLLLAEPIDAHQALDMGLVNAVIAPERLAAASAELAARLAAGPTAAYAAIKEALRYAADAPLPDALLREATLQGRLGASPDHRNAVRAFLAKERPSFSGH